MRERKQKKRFQRTITRLACVWAVASSSPATAQTVFDEPFEPFQPTEEINSTYSLYAAMTQGLEHSFAGVDSLTRVVGFEDLGMGQDIYERCEVYPGIPLCDEMDPLELKALEAEGRSGKSSADLAKMLRDAAEGAMVAGMLLEFGIAEEIGRPPTFAGLAALELGAAQIESSGTRVPEPHERPDADEQLEDHCATASFISDVRAGKGSAEMAGLGPGASNPVPGGQVIVMAESYVSPVAMMLQASCMLLTASRDLTNIQGRDPYRMSSAGDMLEAVNQIRFEGAIQTGNNLAYRLTLDDPGLRESLESGQEFQVDRIQRLIHVDYLTDFKTRINGTLTDRGETREVFMEREFGDFRWLPGTQLYYPFRSTSRIGGILNEEEMEQMSEAAESLDEVERQMAAMSPRERQQMEQMMGPRIEQLRNMVDSGVFEFTQITKRVIVNADAREALSGNVEYEPKLLIQEIQWNLKTLGYDPGEIGGELSRETIVAIVRFERDYQLAPTGRPTPQLARIISATLSAIR